MYAAEVTFEVKDRAGNEVKSFEVFIEGENETWMHISSNPETGKAIAELDNGEYSYRINTREEKNTLIPFKGIFSITNSAKTISTDYTKAKAVNFQPEIPPGYDGDLAFVIEEKTFISVETLTYYGLPGTYKYKLANGLSFEKEFTINQNDIDVNIKLANLQFQLKDVEGNIFPYVYISLYDYERNAYYSKSTDKNGIMELIAVECDYYYNISPDYYLPKIGDFSVKNGIDNKFDISFQDYKKLRLEYKGIANNTSKNFYIRTLDGANSLNYSSNENENEVDLYLPYGEYRWDSNVGNYGDRTGEIDFSEKENTIIIDYSNVHKVTFEITFPSETEDKLYDIIVYQGKDKIYINRDYQTNEYYSYFENGTYSWMYEFDRGEYYGKSEIQPEFTVADKDVKVTAVHSPGDFQIVNINLYNIPFIGNAEEDMYVQVNLFKDGIDEVYDYAYNVLESNETLSSEEFILVSGNYRIKFEIEGADNKSIILPDKEFILENSNMTLNYDLNGTLKKYTFNVKDNSSKEVITPAAVLIYNDQDKVIYGMSTMESEGNDFTLYVNSPSEHILKAVANGYRSGTRSLTTNDLENENFDIFLETANVCAVTFYVEAKNKYELNGATVELEGHGKVITEEGGAIFFDIPMSDNPIAYTVTMPGYETAHGTVIVNMDNVEPDAFGVYEEVYMTPGGSNIAERQACQFFVYPNPATDYIYLNSDKETDGIWTASLFTTNGTLIKTEQVNMDIQPSINVSDLDSGLYFLRLSNGEEVVTVKVMKK